MNYNAIAYINLENIKQNYINICKYSNSSVMAVLKANAYGLGDTEIFTALYSAGCRMFMVAYYAEAIKLKLHAIKLNIKEDIDIVIISQFINPNEIVMNRDNESKINIIPTIYSLEQLESACKHPTINLKNFAIYFDTGFTRLGIKHEFAHYASTIIKKYNNENPLYIISHFANADVDKDETKLLQYNLVQYNKFLDICALFPLSKKSIANSSAILLDKNYHIDFVRSGKGLYGLINTKNKIKLHNVFSLHAHILQVHNINKGDTIGYKQIFTAEKSMKIALISAGYADGVPLQLSYTNNKNTFHYQHACNISYKNIKYKAYIVGAVSMDITAIDVTNIPETALYYGQVVDIFGPNTHDINHVCQKINTNVYSILLNLSQRVKKIYN